MRKIKNQMANFKRAIYIYNTRISPLCEIQSWQITSEIAHFLSGTNARKQQNDFSAMAENDLLDFNANWGELCDHSYFRDLTSNQRRLRK